MSTYFVDTCVCVRILGRQNCTLPSELWLTCQRRNMVWGQVFLKHEISYFFYNERLIGYKYGKMIHHLLNLSGEAIGIDCVIFCTLCVFEMYSTSIYWLPYFTLGNFCKWKTKYKGVRSKWKEKSYIDTYIDTTSRRCVWAGEGPWGFQPPKRATCEHCLCQQRYLILGLPSWASG